MPEELDLPEAEPRRPVVRGTPAPPPAPATAAGSDSLSVVPDPAQVPMDDDEPISLVEESDSDGASDGVSMVRQRGTGLRKSQEVTFKRPLNLTGAGATRCRLFYSRIAIESLENMQMRINEWVDENDIEIKHVGQDLAVMEGKNPKPNLIISVWY